MQVPAVDALQSEAVYCPVLFVLCSPCDMVRRYNAQMSSSRLLSAAGGHDVCHESAKHAVLSRMVQSGVGLLFIE
jgi:hypothetical protein